MFNREQYLNKKYRLARPFLGPDNMDYLHSKYPLDYPRDEYFDAITPGALNETNVGNFYVNHTNLDPQRDNIVTDEIRNIANMHIPIMRPNNLEIGIRLPENISEDQIRPKVRKKMASHIGNRLHGINDPNLVTHNLLNSLIRYYGHQHNIMPTFGNFMGPLIYEPFLNDYINHIDNLPLNSTKPDLLSYMANYKHQSPEQRLILRLLGQGFNDTYPSPSNIVHNDWHKERHGEYAPRIPFKEVVSKHLAGIGDHYKPTSDPFRNLEINLSKPDPESGFVKAHLFD